MKQMNVQVIVLVAFGRLAASFGAPVAPPDSTTSTAPDSGVGKGTSEASPAATSPVPEPPKPDYPKDLDNGVEVINREGCSGGYCETFLIRPPPAGMSYPIPGGGAMGGMQPCCPQLPPSPCGGQQQPSCDLLPPPSGCNSPCPPSFGEPMGLNREIIKDYELQ